MILEENIKSIKGIGEKTASLFNRLGVFNIEDLLHFFPRYYIKYEEPVKLSEALPNTPLAFRLFIPEDFKNRKVKNLNILSGYATDGRDRVNIVYFNAPYYANSLVSGQTYIFYGKLQVENNRYKLDQPAFYKEDEYKNLLGSLQPVYRLTKGLSNKLISKSIKATIEEGQYPYLYEEYLPADIVKEFNLTDRKTAIIDMHFPENYEKLLKARRRLVFDELFIFLSMVRKLKENNRLTKSTYQFIETSGPKRLMEALPYRLTNAQNKVYEEIVKDVTSGYVTNRLVQGDVGSGKTIVAFLSLYLCVENGFQGAMMAPTELLATQHYENLTKLVKEYNLPIKPVLLTGSVKASEKKVIYRKLKEGEYNVAIGTHALIQDKVEFKNLALVVTDEQHRFGVRQRQTLSDKGDTPHILVMSATPIPRTLAIILYGDLNLSIINEKPSNRLPIKNCVVGPEYRPTAYKFLRSEIDKGHQAYVICSMVEESEGMENLENVIDYTEKLRKALGDKYRIEYIHGKMKANDKKSRMEIFAEGNIDVLVSTTVIEVGIDVPNATVIMVENAERFGLSTLHQLRGRIGRGASQSYTIFVNSSKGNKEVERLKVLNNTNDGFEIARCDLKLRGSGDIFGIRQSGEIEFELADIYEDSELIMKIGELLDRIDINENMIKTYLEENQHKFIDFSSI